MGRKPASRVHARYPADVDPEKPVPTLANGLYVVATPIGNLEDFSPRARRVLGAADVVAAEDTRVSGRLLRLAGGVGRLVSLTEHNTAARAPELVAAAREAVVALVSDAGTPAVSDPGARLVEEAHRGNVPVFAIAGPSALAAAVSVAGFSGGPVTFLGFLPRQRSERLSAIRAAARPGSILVLFESPNRLAETIAELAAEFADPEVVVCRELTKLFEENVRGKATALASRFAATRGECTVVVQVPERDAEEASLDDVRLYLSEMHRAGARRSGAAGEAARRFAIPRDAAYALWPTPDDPEGER